MVIVQKYNEIVFGSISWSSYSVTVINVGGWSCSSLFTAMGKKLSLSLLVQECPGWAGSTRIFVARRRTKLE